MSIILLIFMSDLFSLYISNEGYFSFLTYIIHICKLHSFQAINEKLAIVDANYW